MKKIAIVNQRYGAEVNGGSEQYAKMLAEHLSERYEVTILTTTAKDYDTWDNYYPVGVETNPQFKIIRFPVAKTRNIRRFRVINKLRRMLGRCLDSAWVRQQGPYAPELTAYIREQREAYDGFLFVTYLYYPVVCGLPDVADKAILIPTAHDEPYIYFPIYKKIFTNNKGIVYLTEEEKNFVESLFMNQDIPNEVVGAGIEIPEEYQDDNNIQQAIVKYSVHKPYVIYAGRIDVGKNCDEMFQYFEKYKENNPDSELELVLIGQSMITIPERTDIHYLGFVPEKDKYALLAGAKCLWMPSRYESLSIALLEGMGLGVPGIVNGRCEVLKGHCAKSGGAVYYTNYEEFEECVDKIVKCSADQYNKMSVCARKYVAKNYHWDIVMDKLSGLIERI